MLRHEGGRRTRPSVPKILTRAAGAGSRCRGGVWILLWSGVVEARSPAGLALAVWRRNSSCAAWLQETGTVTRDRDVKIWMWVRSCSSRMVVRGTSKWAYEDG